MPGYELLINTHARITSGASLSEAEKLDIADRFLSILEPPGAGNIRTSAPKRHANMYPHFFMPSREAGMQRLITGELPKTQLLSANHYELEILRLLALWKGDSPIVRDMVERTVDRLEHTCFGRFCATGECVGAGVAALRFYIAVLPREDARIGRLLQPLYDLYAQCGGRGAMYRNLPLRYFRLALSGIDGWPGALQAGMGAV